MTPCPSALFDLPWRGVASPKRSAVSNAPFPSKAKASPVSPGRAAFELRDRLAQAGISREAFGVADLLADPDPQGVDLRVEQAAHGRGADVAQRALDGAVGPEAEREEQRDARERGGRPAAPAHLAPGPDLLLGRMKGGVGGGGATQGCCRAAPWIGTAAR